MIVSHSHRFIFLRTEKTASTSLTSALETILDESDVIYRTFSGQWKKLMPVSPGGLKRKLPIVFGLHPHATARQARQVLGKRIFDSYFKFSVERDPWDRQLSLYSHRIYKEEKSKSLTDFDRDMKNWLWRTRYYTRLNNWAIYAIGNQIVADKVIKFNELETGLEQVFRELGIDGSIVLPHKRRSPSGDRLAYENYYSHETKDRVANWYKKEIENFGFEFIGQPKL